MNEIELKSNNRIGPILGEVPNIAVTTSSLATDLGPLFSGSQKGDFVTLKAVGGNIWFAFDNATGGTIDDTSPADAARGFFLAENTSEDYRFPSKGGLICDWVVAKTASGTATLLVHRSSSTED